MTTTITLARNPAYEDDDSEELVSKATWPLKLSGLLFAGMLVLGRSATYGNITWAPAHHGASAPLVVVVHATDPSTPGPSTPKSVPLTDPGALGTRSAADEVVTFSPGSNSGDDEDNPLKAKNDRKEKDNDKERDRDKDHEGKTVLRAAQVNNNNNTAGEADNATANSPGETANETNGEGTGQATASANTGNTNHETANETNGDLTAQGTASATGANGQNNANNHGPNNNGPNNVQGNRQANVQVLSGAQAAWFGRTEETPWPALAAVGGLMTLIGLAFLKPWRFLRRFIR